MTVRIINSDVFDGLRQLPDESVHCVVTSPPYFGLRDYGVDGQIGNEPSFSEHLTVLVRVFQEVRRVLRSDGTLWLNYGDAYAGSWGAQGRQGETGQMANRSIVSARQIASAQRRGSKTGSLERTPGLKPKDLMLMPARLAIALCDDGWWVRSAIVWHKPNPMPESCGDRPTSSYENVFLLAKSARYFYDADAVREASTVPDDRLPQGRMRNRRTLNNSIGSKGNANGFRGGSYVNGQPGPRETVGNVPNESLSRNLRNVWEIATEPFKESHFATMPTEVASRCIKAGCPAGGTVLDPFGGAGTTGLVADRLSRNAILIELNPQYTAMAQRRIENDVPMFAEVAPEKLKEPTLFEEVA